MKSKLLIRVMSLLLAGVMAGTYIPTIVKATEEAPKKEETTASLEETKEAEAPAASEDKKDDKVTKDETIYVNLNPDGSLREVIITDKIHSEDPNAVIKDKSDLINLEVIKGGSIKEQKDGNITWQMEAKDLYYRGVSTKELPFDVSIKYFLDGKEMKYDKIAGKSGDLKITVDFKNNLSQKKEYKGRMRNFSSPMGIAAILSLPTDKFTKVEGEDVAITTEGDNTMVAVACVPGLYESLNLSENKVEEIEDLDFPEHFEITCHVENFEMGNIALTATGGFPTDEEDEFDLSFIDELDENLQKVKRIKDKFESMDDDRTLRDMLLDDEKLDELQEMSKDIDALLDMNTDFANNLDKYVTKDAVDALSEIIEEAEEIDLRFLKDFDYAEKYEDKHGKPVNNPQLGKGIEKALDLFDVFDLDTLNEAYLGMGKLKANEDALKAGCVQLLTNVFPGKYSEAVLSNMPLEGLLPIVAGLNLYKPGANPPINEKSVEALKEQIIEDKMPEAIIGAVMGMLNPGKGALEKAQKAEDEALKAQEEAEKAKEEAENAAKDEEAENKEPAEENEETKLSLEEAEANLEKAEAKAERAAMIAEKAGKNPFPDITGALLEKIEEKVRIEVSRQVDAKLNAMLSNPDTFQLLGAAYEYVSLQAKLQPMLDATVAIGEFPRDAYLRVVVNNTRNLYDDFLKLYPTIQKMKKDLENDNIMESFKQSPEMVDILVRLKKQLDENTELSDSLRKLQDDANIEIVKDIVSTLDEIDRDKLVEEYTDKLNKLQDMVSRKDILKDMADENTCYTQKGEDMETSYKFVLKTDEIKIPEANDVVEEKEELTGIRKFFANLFK